MAVPLAVSAPHDAPHPPRLTSRPFPPYAHRPGITPHPITDPRGHSYTPPRDATARQAAAGHAPAVPFDGGRWHECAAYLYGIDLHNHGYWWEAHEEWETLWKASPPGSAHGRLLQALIQSCAIWLKLEVGEHAGVERLLARAGALVAATEPGETVLGVRVCGWWQAVWAEANRCLAAKNEADRRVCPPMLRPER